MKGLKIYLDDDLEKRFRKAAMESYGYARGSISRAAEDAIRGWLLEHEALPRGFRVPEDPVAAIRGMLSDVGKSGVELQHEARRIRAERKIAGDVPS